MAHVSAPARLLGFSGLLPPLALVLAQIVIPDPAWPIVTFAYTALIFSFLGGLWWTLALGRETRQTPLLLAAVMPSLVAFALFLLAVFRLSTTWPLVLLGSAVFLTLLVDRHLATTGEAPTGWMGLRIPLSLGLGTLTILMALLTR